MRITKRLVEYACQRDREILMGDKKRSIKRMHKYMFSAMLNDKKFRQKTGLVISDDHLRKNECYVDAIPETKSGKRRVRPFCVRIHEYENKNIHLLNGIWSYHSNFDLAYKTACNLLDYWTSPCLNILSYKCKVTEKGTGGWKLGHYMIETGNFHQLTNSPNVYIRCPVTNVDSHPDIQRIYNEH